MLSEDSLIDRIQTDRQMNLGLGVGGQDLGSTLHGGVVGEGLLELLPGSRKAVRKVCDLTLLVLHLQHDLGPLVEGGDLLLSAGHRRVTGVLIFQDVGSAGPVPGLVFRGFSRLTDADVLLNHWKTAELRPVAHGFCSVACSCTRICDAAVWSCTIPAGDALGRTAHMRGRRYWNDVCDP